MRFWDASAIVPLLVQEPITRKVKELYREDPQLLVWWSTSVECVSAVTRRQRQGDLEPSAVEACLSRLDDLSSRWNEVQPLDDLRTRARRLLRVHSLRGGDALQLAAAIVASDDDPPTLPFVCLDQRLADAARREGFVIVEAT